MTTAIELWCEDASHDRPRKMGTFVRGGADHGTWGASDTEQLSRGGGQDGVSRLYEWYEDPAPGRSLALTSNAAGIRIRCPQCRHSRRLTWQRLEDLLQPLAQHGVPRLSLQQVARILTT